jgi:predicted phosphoribosyltransferase
MMEIYKDREEAGQRLANELSAYAQSPCVVLGIPRGGVVVAAQVALRLNCPLDIAAPRKIGAPGEPEYAIGAICSWGPERFINEQAVHMLRIPVEYIESESAYQMEEAKRRLVLYRGSVDPPELAGKVVIVVDDGVATGYTTRAALASIRRINPLKLILAVPVGAPDSILALRSYADDVICPEQPTSFRAVGNWYRYFDQTSDNEVITILREAGH